MFKPRKPIPATERMRRAGVKVPGLTDEPDLPPPAIQRGIDLTAALEQKYRDKGWVSDDGDMA